VPAAGDGRRVGVFERKRRAAARPRTQTTTQSLFSFASIRRYTSAASSEAMA
jgi:hypothetical protein